MDKLTYFKSYVAIVEKGSLKLAADYLNLTPSAVSKHLSRLELFYGADLAVRDAKHLRISTEGKVFYQRCKDVLQSLSQAEELFLGDGQQGAAILRITLSQVLSQGCIMQMLAAFSRAYPQIKLDIITANKHLDLVEQEIDFAFRGGELADSQMRSFKLWQARTILCAPSSYSSTLTEQQVTALITDNSLIPSYVNLSTLRIYLKKIGIDKPLDQFTAIDDAFSYRNAVIAGMGVGIFLDFFIERAVAQGSVWQITKPHAFTYKSINFNMIYHKNVKLAKSHQLFKNFVIDYFPNP